MHLITGIPLSRRVHSEFARTRLSEAAYDAAMDALHPVLHDVSSPQERAWLREALAGPLHRAAEAAIDVLAIELDVALEDAPASLRRKLGDTPPRRVPGWE